MLKKSITYTDFNDNERTEDFYFNLTKAELIELELTTDGGFSGSTKAIIESNNSGKIILIFKQIVSAAYGEKSDDGRTFEKSESLSEKFTKTEAYSVLFMELISESESAVEFINGLIPAGMAAEVEKMEADKAAAAKQMTSAIAPNADKPRLTLKEMQELSSEELEARLRRGDSLPTTQ